MIFQSLTVLCLGMVQPSMEIGHALSLPISMDDNTPQCISYRLVFCFLSTRLQVGDLEKKDYIDTSFCQFLIVMPIFFSFFNVSLPKQSVAIKLLFLFRL